MRRISASYIFNGKGQFYKNGILELDDNNTVTGIVDTCGEIKETPFLEHYNGIITPGFVNSHCHLELSYLKGKLNTSQNLSGFVRQMLMRRNENNSNVHDDIEKADREMQANGIVACGDISNSSDSFIVKSKSKIKYHTFIELLGYNSNRIIEIFDGARKLQQLLLEKSLKSSIVPHAAYSVIPELMKLIVEQTQQQNTVISVHNQESKEEDGVFGLFPEGELAEILLTVGLRKGLFGEKYSTSFEFLADSLNNIGNILFVHNVFTRKRDIELIRQRKIEYYWVFCPKSNLYISNRIPDINLFKEETGRICIGTDSLASNTELSVLEEMKILQLNFPDIVLGDLLTWGTYNGAKALKMDDGLGSFDKGKKPGVNLVYNLDLQNMKLNSESKIKVIV